MTRDQKHMALSARQREKRAFMQDFLQRELGHLPGFYIGRVPCGFAVSSSAFLLRGGDRAGAFLVLDRVMRVEGETIWQDFIDGDPARDVIAAVGASLDEDSWDIVIPAPKLAKAPQALLRMMILRQTLDGLAHAKDRA